MDVRQDQMFADLESQNEELKALGISVVDQVSIEEKVEAAVDEALVKHKRKQKQQLLKKEIKEIGLQLKKLKNKDEDSKNRLSEMSKRFINPRQYMDLEKSIKESSDHLKELSERRKYLEKKDLAAQNDVTELDDLNLDLEDGELFDDDEPNKMIESERDKLIREGKMTPFGTFVNTDTVKKSSDDADCFIIPEIPKEKHELKSTVSNIFHSSDISQSTLFKLLTKKIVNPVRKDTEIISKSITTSDSESAQKVTRFEKYLQDQVDKQLKQDSQTKIGTTGKYKHESANLNYGVPKKKKKLKEFLGSNTKHPAISKKKSPLKKATLMQKKYGKEKQLGSGMNDLDNRLKSTRRPISEHVALDISDGEKDSDSDYDPCEEQYSSDEQQSETEVKKLTSQIRFSKKRNEFRPNKDDGLLENYKNRIQNWKMEKLVAKKKRIDNEESDEEDDEDSFEEFKGGLKIPLSIWNKLYKYQKTGVRWLWELHSQECGGILADEMGLGKTIEIIAFLIGISYSGIVQTGRLWQGLGPVLIVCPATVLHQWVKEFHKWWPPFRVAVLHDSGSFTGSRDSLIHTINTHKNILIVSYTGLRKSLNTLIQYDWDYLILDEGHKIRNPEAQITVAVKRFNTSHRLILSGSPIQNSLKELWSLFDFIFPGKLGTLQVFLQQFAVPITQGGYANASKLEVQTAFKCAIILRDTINPYLLRRMKSDVRNHLSLPDKNEQVLFCGLSDEQRGIYRSYIDGKEVQNIMKGGQQVFVGLINLRKICNHPDLFSGGPTKLIVGEEEQSGLQPELSYGCYKRSGKMMVLYSILRLWNKQDHKVLLFTQSRQMLRILEKFLQDECYTYLKMDGTTNVSSRQPMIEKFNSNSSIFIFLLTTRVGGLGVNLTGADRVIIYDPDWNPSTDTQARERAWRIGQTRHVTIYRLLTAGTIEEKIYHRQIFKQFLTNRVLKDPKQQRFFKSNDLFELFTLNEGNKEKTESSVLFAGTGSEIKMKSKSTKSNKRQHNRDEMCSGNKRRKLSNLLTNSTKIESKISNETNDTDIATMNCQPEADPIEDERLDRTQLKENLNQGQFEEKINLFPDESIINTGLVTRNKTDCDQINFDEDKKLKMMELARLLCQKIMANKESGEPKNGKKTKKGKKFEGGERIEFLIKKRNFKKSDLDEQEETQKNKSQDDFVLQKLFKKSVVHTALSHDVIINASDPDYLILESEAEKVAQEAMKQVRLSRRNWKSNYSKRTKRPKFGVKKNSIMNDREEFAKTSKKIHRKKMSRAFDGNISEEESPDEDCVKTSPSSSGDGRGESSGILSSSQLLKRMRERNRMQTCTKISDRVAPSAGARADGYDPAYPSTADEVDTSERVDLDPEIVGQLELLTDIRNFVAFQAVIDGQASTDEIVKRFKERLPLDQSHIFKALLNQICDFKRSTLGEGIWYIKEEFR